MFTTGTAIDSFRTILLFSSNALENEVAYAVNQCIRQEAALASHNPDEFDSAQFEFEAAMADAALYSKAAYSAFSALVLLSALSASDADNVDRMRMHDQERKTLIIEQRSIKEVRDAEYL
jgi:hypothetical protein